MKEWRKVKLGDIAVISYGYTAKASVENVGLKFLRITDIQNDLVNWSSVPYCQITEDDFKKYKLIDQDIVFARTGATTGKSYLVCDPPESVAASYLIRLRIKDSTVSAKFISKYFQTSEYWDSVSSGISGSAQGGFNASKLSVLVVNIPALPEQKRIVAILDEAFEAIDRAIANTEKNLANSREVFESYLNAIFTQKGDGWIEKKLEDICKEITVGHVGSMASKYKDSGIPFLRSQNILPFRIKLDNVVFIDDKFHSELKKSQLRPGDVAIVRTGYPGTAAVIPEELEIVNCSDLVIVKSGEHINPHYLCLFFNSVFGKTLVGSRLVGAAQKHFNITTAKKVLIPFPCLTKQNYLVTKMDELAAETQRLETIYRQKIAALKELKQSILQKAFTGELTSNTPKTVKEEIAA